MNLPKPFLGRAVLEVSYEDVEAYMKEKAGIGKDSKIVLPDDYKTKHSVPLKKGKLVSLAPDFCGERFRLTCGKDITEFPELGDIVWFVPNETYPIDLERKYHIINDSDIIAYEKVNEND